MSSWSPIDLSAVIDGSYSPPQPTVGNRVDGVSLFYKGRVHAVVGDSESGKTWLVLAVACDELAAGNVVLYVDFEDDEGGIAGRLLALGAQPPLRVGPDRGVKLVVSQLPPLPGGGEGVTTSAGQFYGRVNLLGVALDRVPQISAVMST